MHDGDFYLGYIADAGLTLKATALLPRQSTPPLLETAPKAMQSGGLAHKHSPALRLKIWPIWCNGHIATVYNRLSRRMRLLGTSRSI